jgi:hypothetical protein
MRAEGFEPSSSLEHRPLKPACLPVPPHPRFTKDRSENESATSDPAEQERESQELDQTTYEEPAEQEFAERRELSEDVQGRLPEREDEAD